MKDAGALVGEAKRAVFSARFGTDGELHRTLLRLCELEGRVLFEVMSMAEACQAPLARAPKADERPRIRSILTLQVNT
jgi:hypothetical protein